MSDIFSSQTKHLVFRSPGIGLIDVDIHGNLTVHSDETTTRDALIVEGNTKLIGRPSNTGPDDNALEVEGDVRITSLGVGKPGLLVQGDVDITGDTDIIGDTEIHGGLGVGLDTELHGNLTVDLNTSLLGSLSVQGGTTLEGPLTVNDNAHITGDLTVDTHTTLNTLNVKGDSVFDQTVLISGDLTVRGDITVIGNGEQIIENQKSLAVEDPLLYLNFGVLNIAQDPESKGMIIDRGLFSIINVNTGTGIVATVERVNYENGKWFIKLDGSGIPVWRDDPTYSHHGQTLTTAVINSGTYPAPTPSPINNTNAPASVVWSEAGGTGGTGSWLLNWALQDRRSLSPDGGTTTPATLPAVPIINRTLRGLDTPLTSPAVDYAVNVKYLTQETDKINDRITNLKMDNLFDVQATGPVQDAVLYYDTALINWVAREFEIRRDTTPDLGGNLDVKTFSIVSKGAGTPIKLAPSSDVSTSFIQLTGVTGTETISTSASTSLVLSPTTDLKLNAVVWPKTAGTLDQIAALDSSGNRLVWKNTVHSIVAGAGLSSQGAKTTGDIIFDVNVGGAGTGIIMSTDTIVHEDTSTQANVTNTNGFVIQSLTFDTFGHVKTASSIDLDGRYSKIIDSEATYVKKAGDTMTGNLTAPNFVGHLTGNADTATKWATTRTITLTGDVTGTANIDGTANVSITAAVVDDSHNHTISNIDGLQDIITNIEGDLSPTFIQDHVPTEAEFGKPIPPGAFWYDTVGGRLYIYYNDVDSNQWVEASPMATPEEVLRYELATNTGAGMIGTTSGNTVQVELNNKVPVTRTVNTKPLSTDIVLNAADVGAVNTTNGVAPFAARLQTIRTISLTGDATGSATFDGSANASITVAVTDDSHSHVISNIDSLQGALDAKLDATAKAASAATADKLTTARTLSLTGDATGSTTFDGTANASITVVVTDNSHAHTIANISGLQTALDSTADAVHTHAIADITNLQSTLDGKSPTSHSHTAASVGAVPNTGGTINGKLTINTDSNAIIINSASGSASYILNQEAGANSWYVGRGGATDDVTFHNYVYGTSLTLASDRITSNKLVQASDFYVTSDRRLKTNFTPIVGAMDKIGALTGLIYDKAEHLGSYNYTREIGLVADDVMAVLPEAVTTFGPDKIKTISQSALIGLLVEGMKEMQAEIQELKRRLK